MDLFSGRVLLTPELAETLPGRLVLVAIRSGANEESISFTLFAPGMTENDFDSLRRELNQFLAATLSGIHPNWIYNVEVEPDGLNGSPETFVTIGNPRLVGNKAEGMILKVIETYLTMQAGSLRRQEFVLGAKQLLVPLNFKMGHIAGSSYLAVKLPRELLFVDECACKVAVADGKRAQVTDTFERILGASLRAKDCAWRRLHVSGSLEGATIRIFFEDLQSLDLFQLETIETVVARTLEARTQYPSAQLVFLPIYPHHVDQLAENAES